MAITSYQVIEGCFSDSHAFLVYIVLRLAIHSVYIGLFMFKSHCLIQLVGGCPFRVGGQHQRGDALRFHEIDGVAHQHLTESFSAISFVYHHIFYPCFSTGGGMIDSDGQHSCHRFVIQQEEEMAVR